MCGIAGFQVAKSAAPRPEALDRFQSSLFHRGPDAQAQYVTGQTGLVSTRLAIIDLTGGDQPLFSKKGSVLVANGEIYNAPELRKELPDYPFYTGSDCEPMLPLYEAHGLDFVDHLRGMYAVAIVEPETGRLVLARDQFGIKPLYYVEGEDFFAFASELPALVEAGFVAPDVDDVSLAELLQVKYVCGTRTINSAVRRVEPGETIVVEDGKIRERRAGKSWPPCAKAQAAPRTRHMALRPPSALLKKFETVMFDSVMVHLRTDAPWRLYYSGGIDSTILMLAAREVAVSPYQALTVGYEGKSDQDESWVAMRLAQGANVACERIEMTTDDFWTLAPRIAAAMDDPMADQAALPLYMLARETHRQAAKVAICGEGGDEIFGGYSRYQRATLPSLLRRRQGRRGVFDKSEVAAGRFAGWSRSLDALELSQDELWSTRLEVLQAIDILERLPNCLLIKLDRALMANGVEGRTPFLDREVIAFARELPGRFKTVPGQGKRLLRDWLAHAYPQAQPHAKKRGFGVPVAKWMHPRRDELGRLVSMQPGVARAVDAGAVRQVFDQCLERDQQAWSSAFLCAMALPSYPRAQLRGRYRGRAHRGIAGRLISSRFVAPPSSDFDALTRGRSLQFSLGHAGRSGALGAGLCRISRALSARPRNSIRDQFAGLQPGFLVVALRKRSLRKTGRFAVRRERELPHASRAPNPARSPGRIRQVETTAADQMLRRPGSHELCGRDLYRRPARLERRGPGARAIRRLALSALAQAPAALGETLPTLCARGVPGPAATAMDRRQLHTGRFHGVARRQGP